MNGAGSLRFEGRLSAIVRSTGVFGLLKDERVDPSAWDGAGCEVWADVADAEPRRPGRDRFVRSCLPEALGSPGWAESLGNRGPMSLRVEIFGDGEDESGPVGGRLETDDWVECPRRDWDLLNLDRGAPLSETVSS